MGRRSCASLPRAGAALGVSRAARACAPWPRAETPPPCARVGRPWPPLVHTAAGRWRGPGLPRMIWGSDSNAFGDDELMGSWWSGAPGSRTWPARPKPRADGGLPGSSLRSLPQTCSVAQWHRALPGCPPWGKVARLRLQQSTRAQRREAWCPAASYLKRDRSAWNLNSSSSDAGRPWNCRPAQSPRARGWRRGKDVTVTSHRAALQNSVDGAGCEEASRLPRSQRRTAALHDCWHPASVRVQWGPMAVLRGLCLFSLAASYVYYHFQRRCLPRLAARPALLPTRSPSRPVTAPGDARALMCNVIPH